MLFFASFAVEQVPGKEDESAFVKNKKMESLLGIQYFMLAESKQRFHLWFVPLYLQVAVEFGMSF